MSSGFFKIKGTSSLVINVEECFHLSASPFFLTYIDDDGEEFSIKTDSDLTEAIAYFVSGDDDAAGASIYSGHSVKLPFTAQKISIRVEVVVEYDGPSLSDTSSISSFSTGFVEGESQRGSGSGSSAWGSSRYSESLRSGRSGRTEQDFFTDHEGNHEDGTISAMASGVGEMSLSTSPISDHSMSLGSRSSIRHSRQPARQGSVHSQRSTKRLPSRQSSGDTALPYINLPLTGPESVPAPSLLTNSELGSRWLREQSKLATTRRLGPTGANGSRRYDSDDDSLGSDEESLGDLALVRDARGKFYYSYHTAETASITSRSDFDLTLDELPGSSRRPRSIVSSIQTISPPTTPTAETPDTNRRSEPAGPPILAPDCSACGIRLDYMRYVCQTCGEGEMWKENAPDKTAFICPRVPSESSASEGSEETEYGARHSNGSQTVYRRDMRTRSGSMSTNASRGSGSRSDGEGAPHLDMEEDGMDRPKRTGSLPRGYELCAGCIEFHGIAHAKAAAKEARSKRNGVDVRRKRRAGELRHTFREKMWGPEGWMDVEYNDEDSRCTICRTMLIDNRYRCVSCPKFDLCRSCYPKVEEIHPAHAFLSLPDIPFSAAGPSHLASLQNQDLAASVLRPARHPGAFCHNCLQDIVGPRFHCAVCPSWDLCIQCEGLAGVGEGSGHTADHIMMKIPLPLATNEVAAVSRRARDRWFQQDLNAISVAAAANVERPPSSRSSSPTNDTVYAGGSPLPPSPTQVVNITARDALDHSVKCKNCSEWIMGRRYQCANCPSDPEAYNLCSICELRSYRIHDPRHVFFKFDRPVHHPLKSSRPFLPILYRSRVGEVPTGAVVNPRDPTGYLKHVLHKETLCDIHSDQIRGIWLRCAHCAAGFDICQDAEQIANHDPTHVFVVFKARVDMGVFRQLADLASAQSKPLLRDQVYLD